MNARTLATQTAALTCLAGLAVSHPHLPGAYITMSQHIPDELKVLLDSPSAVEAWREALHVPAETVVAGRLGDRPLLEFRATVYRVAFHVYAVYDPATLEAVVS
ncbi:hypothetical protein [Streptomyces iranensis]|uniref:hypothetical protein n=1 Tax=Streptomyces iranensis TaxID=576784 RepID=UPI0039B76DA2